MILNTPEAICRLLARNVSGEVILYADTVTDSMRTATDETERRRAIQLAYNAEHGIEPQTIRKAIHDIAQCVRKTEVGLEPSVAVPAELGKLPRSELARLKQGARKGSAHGVRTRKR